MAFESQVIFSKRGNRDYLTHTGATTRMTIPQHGKMSSLDLGSLTTELSTRIWRESILNSGTLWSEIHNYHTDILQLGSLINWVATDTVTDFNCIPGKIIIHAPSCSCYSLWLQLRDAYPIWIFTSPAALLITACRSNLSIANDTLPETPKTHGCACYSQWLKPGHSHIHCFHSYLSSPYSI